MYYDKQIRYMDYLENGEKQRNCGHIKITVTGGRLLLEMQIRGLYATDDVTSEVMLEGRDVESRIGVVNICQGSGSFQWEIQDSERQGEELLLKEGLSYGQLRGIAVHLSSRRSLHCVWREFETDKAAAAVQEEIEEQGGKTDQAVREEREAGYVMQGQEQQMDKMLQMPQERKVEETERTPEMPEAQEEPEISGGEKEGRSEEESKELKPAEKTEELPEALLKTEVSADSPTSSQEDLRMAETSHKAPSEPPAMPMSENKWQQLQRIYPHIRPFQDEREYLSLRPEDFVILPANAYRLVQNSFLLHENVVLYSSIRT